MMSRRQEFVQAGTAIIPTLENYITQLRHQRQTRELSEQIVILSERLFELRNVQISAEDMNLTQAIAAMREANRRIQEEIAGANEFSNNVQTAAAIAGLIRRAIGLAVA